MKFTDDGAHPQPTLATTKQPRDPR